VVRDGDDRDEPALDDVRDGVREAAQDVTVGAVLHGPATGVVDDERDRTLDQLVKTTSDSAIAFGIEAKAIEEIGFRFSRKR